MVFLQQIASIIYHHNKGKTLTNQIHNAVLVVFKAGIMEGSIPITPKLMYITAYKSMANRANFLSKPSAEAFEVDHYSWQDELTHFPAPHNLQHRIHPEYRHPMKEYLQIAPPSTNN